MCQSRGGAGRTVLVSLVLALPFVAAAQAASLEDEVNVLNQAMGTCDYGPGNGPRTVRWGANGGAATVLTGVSGFARNRGTALNANGQIIGKYEGAGDFANPFYWDPDAGTVVAIAPLPGGSICVATDLSDTSLVVGVSETLNGHAHAFEWTAAGGSVDLGVLSGGNNSAAGAISQNGQFAAGTSEGGTHIEHQVLINP